MRCDAVTTATEIIIGREKSNIRNHYFDIKYENATKTKNGAQI